MEPSLPSPQVNQKESSIGETSTLYKSCQLLETSTCIRVLDILPIAPSASNPDTEPIKCSLRVINLNNQPRFAALSYVWGTYSPVPDFIVCNSIQVKVTSNCYSALWHLRKKLGKYTIWLDAVCINQADRKEKSQQIPLMGKIFSLAECVYIWLGEGTDATDRAMAYLANAGLHQYHKTTKNRSLVCRPYAAAWSIYFARWSTKYHPIPFNGKRPGLSTSNIHAVHGLLMKPDLSRSCKPLFGGKYATFSDLQELLSKSWITRLWTYQEILLASNPVVTCGNAHVPWPNFERGVFFLDNTSLFNPHGITTSWASVALSRERLQKPRVCGLRPDSSALKDYGIFVQRISRASVWVILIRFWIYFLTGISLFVVFINLTFLKILHSERTYKLLLAAAALSSCILLCGIIEVLRFLKRKISPAPKKDFANEELLIGLYSRTATDPKDMAFGMWAILEQEGTVNLPDPDYSHNVAEIYRALTIHLAHITQSLDLLLLAAVRGVPGQPSWVPDWSAHGQHEWGDNILQLPATNSCGYYIQNHSATDAYVKVAAKLTPKFQINETGTILTVQGLHICDISLCFRFQWTNGYFQESERENHLENLRLMLIWASWKPGKLPGPIRYDKYQTSFPRNLLSTVWVDESSVFSGLNAQHVKKWTSFCLKNHNKNPSELLSVLCSNSDILSIQIVVCNFLAVHKRVPFHARSPEDPDTPILGACSRKVQIGDQVLRIGGVPQLLIARAQGDEQTIKIISPAVFYTIWLGKRNNVFEKRGANQFKRVCRTYQIC
jgi:hypothetical protein